MDLCRFDCFETTYEHNPQASVLVVWAWGCCGVALMAVLPVWRVPVATPAGKLLVFEALSLGKIRGHGGRCWLWWLCGRADLSFCYGICFLISVLNLPLDQILSFGSSMHLGLVFLLLSFPLMDKGNGQQGIFTRSCFPSSLGSPGNNSPSMCG